MDKTNPWDVYDVSEFLKYCCPECDTKCDQLPLFKEHAISTHERSMSLFGSEKPEDTSNHEDSESESEEHEFPMAEVLIKEEPEDPDNNFDPNDNEYDNEVNDYEANDNHEAHNTSEDSMPEALDNDNNDISIVKIESETRPESENIGLDPLEEKNESGEAPPQMVLFTSLTSNEYGWWCCQECIDECFLFDFELLKHYREVHGKIALLGGLAIKTEENILQRNELLAQSKWKCLYCPEGCTHDSKLQLLEHWEKMHRSDFTFEVCQWCLEMFVGKNYWVSSLIYRKVQNKRRPEL